MFYFNYKDFNILGSSPEILVRLRQGEVTIRPIAGTRPRGRTSKEDKKDEKVNEDEILSLFDGKEML